MKSLWTQTCQLPQHKELGGDLRAQNVVIGAGIAGILIAYLLQEKGQEVIVLEAKEVASGQTKNTTAKITSQHGYIYYDMIKNSGLERAKGYAKANEEAIQKYKEIITKEGISCHFEELPSFLYSVKQDGIEKLKKEAKAAKALEMDAEYLQGNKITELPFGVMGAVRFMGQAQFHPLEFIQEIAKKLTIYEHTNVLEVDDHFVITNRGVVVAENVIFATHYPFPIIPGYYFLRQHQSRSYALALKGKGVPEQLDGMYYGIDKDGLSFRTVNGQLILGGSSHRTGKQKIRKDSKPSCTIQLEHKTHENSDVSSVHPGSNGEEKVGVRQGTYTDEIWFQKGNFAHLRKKAAIFYPEAEETAHWAAQDCMPHDKIPFIGKFSVKKENWYVATGFQKWGMTTAMVSAMIISDMIIGQKNPYEKVFSPQRLLIKAGIKDFFVDAGESTIGLIKGIFAKKDHKCSHMGCALSWNEEEQSWDCPCHGSRYTKEGELIDNPAQRNISSNK